MSARGEQGLNRGAEWGREQELRERDVCKRGTGTEQRSRVGEGTGEQSGGGNRE